MAYSKRQEHLLEVYTTNYTPGHVQWQRKQSIPLLNNESRDNLSRYKLP